MIRPEQIIDALHTYAPSAETELIWQAYAYSSKVHGGQVRLSGEPYLSHPLMVAYILTQLKMDRESVIAGLLHDTVEDTFATLEDIEKHFGREVAMLVDGVTKISLMTFSSHEEEQAENFRKIILAMAKDIRVILIKLADRLHNMRTLQFIKPEKQLKIARETMDIYSPLANRLGIGWLKTELEDLAFKYLEKTKYEELSNAIAAHTEEQEPLLAEIIAKTNEMLEGAGYKFKVSGRHKSIFSIYKKMLNQNIEFSQVYDILGARILCDTKRDCYSILGEIHSHWTPIPDKFKDYIGLPKENGYQSLHTTVIGPSGKPVEFQIRTWNMHKVNEEGIAAHWQYKEKGVDHDNHAKEFAWLRQIIDWHQDEKNPREFLRNVKLDLFPNEVFVFTPNGEVKRLAQGATPVDFAYMIHTEVGNKCIGARINGKMVPLKHRLQNGDIVEILTSSQAKPSRDWLHYATTSRAKSKIKATINALHRQRSIELGREMLDSELRKYDVNPKDYLKHTVFLPVAQAAGYSTEDGIFSAIGVGKYPVSQFVGKLLPPEVFARLKQPQVSALRRIVQRVTNKPAAKQVLPGAAIKVSGADDILIRKARCCNPVPGDEIAGFVSRGRGVIIHRTDCPNISQYASEPERHIDVVWNMEVKKKHAVQIQVETQDRPGMLANVSSAIASAGANILEASIRISDKSTGKLLFRIEIDDLNQLRQILGNIKDVRGVKSAERVLDLKQTKKKRL